MKDAVWPQEGSAMRGSQFSYLSIVAFTGALVFLGSAVVLYLGAFSTGWTVSALFDGILGGLAVAGSAYMIRLGLDLRMPSKLTDLTIQSRVRFSDQTRRAA